MDKKKSLLNIISGVVFKMVLLIVTLFTRRFLIKYIGNDANGLISLFTSILGFLELMDLGVGAAISFSMYKPIVERDKRKVCALFCVYRRVYLIIGGVVFVVGLAIIPLLPYLAKDYSLPYSLTLAYILQLLGVITSYTYGAEVSLINAYKNNFITTAVYSVAHIVRNLLQMFLLATFQNFYAFLAAWMIADVIQFVFFVLYTRKEHREIVTTYQKILPEDKKELIKNIKAIFMHRIGDVMLSAIDSIIISSFMGIVILGYYSNYVTIVNALVAVATLVFTQVMSVIGHTYYEVDKAQFKKYFNFFYLLNYFLASFIFLCFFACIDPFIDMFFGTGLLLDNSVVIIMTISYFVTYMRQAVILFKDSTGLFYYDRYKSIVECLVNLGLSLLLGYFFNIFGILLATIITNITVGHVVEPFVLYKHAFQSSCVKYYLVNYGLQACFVGLLLLFNCVYTLQFENELVQFIVNGLCAAGFALPSFALLVGYTLKTFNIKHLGNFLKRRAKSNSEEK